MKTKQNIFIDYRFRIIRLLERKDTSVYITFNPIKNKWHISPFYSKWNLKISINIRVLLIWQKNDENYRKIALKKCKQSIITKFVISGNVLTPNWYENLYI